MRQEVKSRGSMGPRVSLIVPTLNPGAATFRALLASLRAQRGVDLEIVVADSGSTDGSEGLLDLADVHFTLEPGTFDHGGTRNLAARRASGAFLAFMTQDARPVDDGTLARLVAPVVEGRAAAAYARQVAPTSASPLERAARELNYPATSEIRSLDDLDRLGIRAFMLSNVASVVDRATFEALGGFPDRVVFNEDLYFANALLASGGRIAYVAEAVVEHGHAYTLPGLLRRYFDNATSLATAPEPLRSAPAGSAGLRFALRQAAAVLRVGRPDLLPRWILETGVKWLGYRLGRHHRRLPRAWRARLSLQPKVHGGERSGRAPSA